VRGLSTLIILDYIMETLGNMRGARLEPWQEFDMIAGTSTGGLLAIMLGRLRMSVADCIKAYKDLSRNIFTPTHKTTNVAGKTVDFLKAKGKFHSKPLEDCVKQMLRAQKLPEQELFVTDQDSDSPKVFVCAVEGINSDAVVIRSYKSKEFDDLYGVCKIWEAARATSAASTFFEPIKIGDRMYVDGALKHNNPVEKVDEESQGKSKFHLTWCNI
jgi:patatin-like phospholipase/acyl hydrolase